VRVQAQIARLSGACYLAWDDLKLEVDREQFQVLAGDDTYFTRWYIARGVLNGMEHDTGASVTCVFVRGVMWRSTELDSFRVWQQLSQSWPVRFLEDKVSTMPNGGAIQVHKGIDEMAQELHRVLVPHLRAHPGAHMHSLSEPEESLPVAITSLSSARPASEQICHARRSRGPSALQAAAYACFCSQISLTRAQSGNASTATTRCLPSGPCILAASSCHSCCR
jgi:hypothetical protein